MSPSVFFHPSCFLSVLLSIRLVSSVLVFSHTSYFLYHLFFFILIAINCHHFVSPKWKYRKTKQFVCFSMSNSLKNRLKILQHIYRESNRKSVMGFQSICCSIALSGVFPVTCLSFFIISSVVSKSLSLNGEDARLDTET